MSTAAVANAKLIHELEAQAGAWLRARLLRSYLRSLKRALRERKVEASLDKEPIDFLAWAARYVDQLDPLASTPHDADLMDENLRQYGNEEGVRQTLSRLMGRHWQEAWKIGENLEQADEEDYVADEET